MCVRVSCVCVYPACVFILSYSLLFPSFLLSFFLPLVLVLLFPHDMTEPYNDAPPPNTITYTPVMVVVSHKVKPSLTGQLCSLIPPCILSSLAFLFSSFLHCLFTSFLHCLFTFTLFFPGANIHTCTHTHTHTAQGQERQGIARLAMLLVVQMGLDYVDLQRSLFPLASQLVLDHTIAPVERAEVGILSVTMVSGYVCIMC